MPFPDSLDEIPTDPDIMRARGAATAPSPNGRAPSVPELLPRIAELEQLIADLTPLANLGLQALEESRLGCDYDGDDIQDEAEKLGVVHPVAVPPYCCGADPEAECICAEVDADVCYRDTEGTARGRAYLTSGVASGNQGDSRRR